MRYALVTGGSRGLGRAICLRIARMGIPVIINYQSNEAAAEETLRLVEAEGGSAELARFDVRVKEEVEAALARWEAAHPDDYIAYLVNNAGIRRDNLLYMMPEEDWHDVLQITLDGFFYVTRCLLPRMMRRWSIHAVKPKPGSVCGPSSLYNTFFLLSISAMNVSRSVSH